MDTVILSKGSGKNKREWVLSLDDFEQFEMYYEENELLSVISDEDVLTLDKKDGSTVRQWLLSEDEFETFEMQYEEQELI